MSSKIKLIVFDVDGTLSYGQQAIKTDISRKLCDLESKGIQVCLASGKDHYYLTALVRGMGLSSAWLISENGAILETESGKEYFITSKHDKNELSDINSRIASNFPFVSFQQNEICISIFFNNPTSPDDILDYINSFRSDYNLTFNCFLHPNSIDIVPKCVDKSIALRKIKIEKQISTSEVIAVGDNTNDEKMLLEAKYRIIVGKRLSLLTDARRTFSPEEMLSVVCSIINDQY